MIIPSFVSTLFDIIVVVIHHVGNIDKNVKIQSFVCNIYKYVIGYISIGQKFDHAGKVCSLTICKYSFWEKTLTVKMNITIVLIALLQAKLKAKNKRKRVL